MIAVLEKRRFTVDEFVRLGETGILRPEEHVELIGGDIVIMSPERFAKSPDCPVHSALASVIHVVLQGLFPRGQFCITVHSPFQASANDLPEPDIAVLQGSCKDFLESFPRKAVLVMEVAVTSQEKDRGPKAQIYAKAGVPEYWVLDVPARRLDVLQEPSPEGYRLVRFYTDREQVRPIGVPPESPGAINVAEILPSNKTPTLESHG